MSERREAPKPYTEILEQEIELGLAELKRPSRGLLISGLSAGLDIGFSLLFMAIMLTLTQGVLPEFGVEILVANMYSIGFILVILGRSELFTEHTTLAVLPVLSGHAPLSDLPRVWALIYFANLVGAFFFAAIAVFIGPVLGTIEPSVFGTIASKMVDHPWWVILVSAILAGWMMGLLSWLVAAGRDTMSQIFFVWLITTAIGLGALHHCIVGTVEVMAAVFAGQGTTFVDYLYFLLWATLGNAFGGFFFVALIKYSHASQAAK